MRWHFPEVCFFSFFWGKRPALADGEISRSFSFFPFSFHPVCKCRERGGPEGTLVLGVGLLWRWSLMHHQPYTAVYAAVYGVLVVSYSGHSAQPPLAFADSVQYTHSRWIPPPASPLLMKHATWRKKILSLHELRDGVGVSCRENLALGGIVCVTLEISVARLAGREAWARSGRKMAADSPSSYRKVDTGVCSWMLDSFLLWTSNGSLWLG